MNIADFHPVALADAVDRLGSMPAFLDRALAAVERKALLTQPAPGEFSLVEHACHLRDVESDAYAVRVRRMRLEQSPALAPFDGGAVAEASDYPSQDPFAAARQFAAARAALLPQVSSLTPDELAREGTFGDRRVCFADVIAMMVEHDRGHREEIEALVSRLKGSPWK